MQLLFYAIVGLMLFTAATVSTLHRKIDAPQTISIARNQVDSYRLFMFIANQYMQTYSGGAGTITWSTLKTVDTAPSGIKDVGMPAAWRVVALADSTWVACTDLDERAIGAIQQLAVNGGQNLNRIKVSGADYVVVGKAVDTSKATLCN